MLCILCSHERCCTKTHQYKKANYDLSFLICSLHVLEHHLTKSQDKLIGTWRVIGSPKNHLRFVNLVLKDKLVKELDY